MALRREGYRSKRPKQKRRRTYQYVVGGSPPLEDSPPRPYRSHERAMALSSPPVSYRGAPAGFAFRSPRESPDPDDDPGPANVLDALPPFRFKRVERRNLDIQYSGYFGSGSGTWDIPIPSLVGLARGAGYAERATGYVRVERLAFKITAYDNAGGLPFVDTIPGIPDSVARRNAVYFRFAVIFDKQSDGVSPKVTYPDVFATGPTFALDSFRLPATVDRYQVLHDCTYRWKDGELTAGAFEIGGIAEPFWYQTGLLAHEEIFVDVGKLVHYSSSGNTFAAVASGNMFYMCSAIGRDFNLVINSRTTYSDNI